MKNKVQKKDYGQLYESKQSIIGLKSSQFIQHNQKQQLFQQLNQSIKLIKYPTLAIKPVKTINDWIQSISSQQLKVDVTLALVNNHNLNFIRQIRGDGNCFVRAFIFHYITQIKSCNLRLCFPYIDQLQLTCSSINCIPKKFYPYYEKDFLSYCLKLNWQNQYQNYVKKYQNNYKLALATLLADNPYLDFILVLYTRSLSLLALKRLNNSSYLKNVLVGNDEQSLANYGIQSQGLTHYLLGQILNLNMKIHQLREKQFITYDFKVEKVSPVSEINLLFHNKHYDLLQKQADVQKQLNDPILNHNQSYESNHSKISSVDGKCYNCKKYLSISPLNNLCQKCQKKQKQTYIKMKKNIKIRLQTQTLKQNPQSSKELSQKKRLKTSQSTINDININSPLIVQKKHPTIIHRKDNKNDKKKRGLCGCFG